MPCVNYVKEHTAFIEYAADNNLRPNEILVWEALFHVMNQRANGNYWPDGFIRVKNDRLLTYAPIGFDSLARARNSLAQRGLISYKPGKKNSEVPMYELHYLTTVDNPQVHDSFVDNPVDNRVYSVSYTHTADNTHSNMWDNTHGNMQGNSKGRMSHQNSNLNKGQSIPNKTYSDDEEDAGVGLHARAISPGCQSDYGACDDPQTDAELQDFRRMEELSKTAALAIRLYFGREAAPAEADNIAIMANLKNITPELVAHALKLAAQNGAKTPAAYIQTIFSDWSYQDVRTVFEAEEYRFLEDAQSGRNNYGSGDVVEDFRRLKEAREVRIAKHKEEQEGGGDGGYSTSGIR